MVIAGPATEVTSFGDDNSWRFETKKIALLITDAATPPPLKDSAIDDNPAGAIESRVRTVKPYQ